RHDPFAGPVPLGRADERLGKEARVRAAGDECAFELKRNPFFGVNRSRRKPVDELADGYRVGRLAWPKGEVAAAVVTAPAGFEHEARVAEVFEYAVQLRRVLGELDVFRGREIRVFEQLFLD